MLPLHPTGLRDQSFFLLILYHLLINICLGFFLFSVFEEHNVMVCVLCGTEVSFMYSMAMENIVYY